MSNPGARDGAVDDVSEEIEQQRGSGTSESDQSGPVGNVSRRGALSLAGLAGVGLLGASSSTTADSSSGRSEDLDMNGYDIVNSDNIWPSTDFGSFCTSGSGTGRAQFFNTEQGDHFFRAVEDGDGDDPLGEVQFQAPIRGPSASEPRRDVTLPLRITHGARVDNLSITGENRINVVVEETIDHEGDLAAELLAYVEDLETVNHTFVLPEGTYTWNTTFDPEIFESIGIVGEPEATLEVTSHEPDTGFLFGRRRGGGKEAILRNVTFDIGDVHERDAGIAQFNVEDRGIMENVTLRGRRYRKGPHGGDLYTVLMNVLSEGSTGHVQNVNMPDGGTEVSSNPGHAMGFSSDPPCEGTVYYQDCYVEGFTGHGFYVSTNEGRVVVERSVAKNNGASNIRLGDGDVARDCTIVLDNADELQRPGAGLWFNRGISYAENIKIVAPNAGNDLIRINSGCDGGKINRVNIYSGPETEHPTLNVTQSGNEVLEPVVLENVTVYDDAQFDGGTLFSARIRRENVTLRDVEYRITDPDTARGGILIENPRVTLDNTTVETANTTTALQLGADDATLMNTRLEGTGRGSARLVASGDVDPDTIEVFALRRNNVGYTDWTNAGVSLSELTSYSNN